MAELEVLETLTTPEQIDEAIREIAEAIGRTVRNLPEPCKAQHVHERGEG